MIQTLLRGRNLEQPDPGIIVKNYTYIGDFLLLIIDDKAMFLLGYMKTESSISLTRQNMKYLEKKKSVTSMTESLVNISIK